MYADRMELMSVNGASNRIAGSILPLTVKQLISLAMKEVAMLGSVSRNRGDIAGKTQPGRTNAEKGTSLLFQAILVLDSSATTLFRRAVEKRRLDAFRQ